MNSNTGRIFYVLWLRLWCKHGDTKTILLNDQITLIDYCCDCGVSMVITATANRWALWKQKEPPR